MGPTDKGDAIYAPATENSSGILRSLLGTSNITYTI